MAQLPRDRDSSKDKWQVPHGYFLNVYRFHRSGLRVSSNSTVILFIFYILLNITYSVIFYVMVYNSVVPELAPYRYQVSLSLDFIFHMIKKEKYFRFLFDFHLSIVAVEEMFHVHKINIITLIYL